MVILLIAPQNYHYALDFKVQACASSAADRCILKWAGLYLQTNCASPRNIQAAMHAFFSLPPGQPWPRLDGVPGVWVYTRPSHASPVPVLEDISPGYR